HVVERPMASTALGRGLVPRRLRRPDGSTAVRSRRRHIAGDQWRRQLENDGLGRGVLSVRGRTPRGGIGGSAAVKRDAVADETSCRNHKARMIELTDITQHYGDDVVAAKMKS